MHFVAFKILCYSQYGLDMTVDRCVTCKSLKDVTELALELAPRLMRSENGLLVILWDFTVS